MRGGFVTTTANSIASGGTINGDLTIDGDLTVSGDSSGAYSEIITDGLQITKDTDGEFVSLILVNQSDAADTTGIISQRFDLEDTGGTAVDSGKILVGKEASFTATASTQDSYMAFQTSLNGSLAEKVRITSDGKVGIGYTGANVDELLHVQNDSNNAVIKIEAGSSGTGARLQLTSGTNDTGDINFGDSGDTNIGRIKYDHTSNYLAIHTNDTERFRIDSSGNIQSKLASGSHAVNLDTYSTTEGHGASLNIRHSNHASNTVETDDDTVLGTINFKGVDNGSNFDTGAGIQVIQNGSAGTKVPCDMSIFVSSSSATNTVMTLTKDQNVGINTATPSSYNIGSRTLVVSSGSSSVGGITIANPTDGSGYLTWCDTANTTNQAWIGYLHDGNSLVFASNSSERMRIDSSGKVGIGETVPLGNLHVKSADSGSTAHADADELVVEGSTAAGISIISDHDATAKIIFGCAEDTQAARITNTQSTGVFSIGACQTNGVTKIEAGTGNVRMVIDDNSRISLSNNDSGGTGGADSTSGNTLLGYLAGEDIASGGLNNTLIGHGAGKEITTGDENVAIGQSALLVSTTTSDCVAVGSGALAAVNHADADGTVAVGYNAGLAITEAQYSTYVGYQSGKANTAANHNTAFGYNTLVTCTGECNTVVGSHAGDALGNNSHNTVMGYNALSAADSGETNNVVIGSGAGSAINSSGCDDNIIIGYNAGVGNIDQCVAIGFEALQSTATNDVANSRGTVAIGSSALTSLTSANRCVGIGYQALEDLTAGDSGTGHCTAVGYGSLKNATGRSNTAFGESSGDAIVAGTYNTLVGSQTATDDASATNQTVIGYGVTGQADNSVTLGNADVTAVYMASDSGALVHTAGIQFPATQAANAGANVLDDYEEGTWTPRITDGTNTAVAGGNNEGSYTKIGRVVHLTAYIVVTDLTDSGTSADVGSNARISGLPFTVGNDHQYYSSGVISYGQGLAITAGHSVGCYAMTNATTAMLQVYDNAGGTTNMSGSEFSDDGEIMLQLTYVV